MFIRTLSTIWSRRRSKSKVSHRRALSQLRLEHLESRRVLDGTGFPGNECPPDLDLSNVAPQSATVGTEFVLDLLAAGATVVDLNLDGSPTGDVIRWMLDPDVPADTPTGATISSAGVFRWTPTASQIGTHQITVIVVDRGSPPLADAELFTITVRSAAPVLDLNGDDPGTDFAVTYTENDPPVNIVSPNLMITDTDSTTLASATIQLTNLLDGEDEELSVDTNGTSIVATYNSATGLLSLTGVDTIANYQNVLRTLRYSNASDNPHVTSRIVQIRVNDGSADSNTATSTITIIAVNDAPNLAPIGDVTVELGELVEIIVTATDPDSTELTFILDRDDPGSNTPAAATITRIDGNSAVIRWTADAAGTFRFSVLVIDDDPDDPRADRETFSVLVTNNRPTVDLNGDEEGTSFEATFTEGGGFVSIVDPEMTVTHPQDADLLSATITITNLFDGASERVSVDISGTLLAEAYDIVTGILTITGSASAEVYTNVLRSLGYVNASGNPDTTTRIIQVIVSDGTHTSQPAETRVAIVPVPTAPILILPSPYDNDTVPIPITLGDAIDFMSTVIDPDTADEDLVFTLDLTNSNISVGAAQPAITSPPDDVPGGRFTWTPDEIGTFVIEIVVTDSTGLSMRQSFTIVVSSAEESDSEEGKQAFQFSLDDDHDEVDEMFA